MSDLQENLWSKIEADVARLRALLPVTIRAAGLRCNRAVERQLGYSGSSGYVSRLVHGHRQLKLWQILEILAVLDVHPQEFFLRAFPRAEERPPAP